MFDSHSDERKQINLKLCYRCDCRHKSQVFSHLPRGARNFILRAIKFCVNRGKYLSDSFLNKARRHFFLQFTQNKLKRALIQTDQCIFLRSGCTLLYVLSITIFRLLIVRALYYLFRLPILLALYWPFLGFLLYVLSLALLQPLKNCRPVLSSIFLLTRQPTHHAHTIDLNLFSSHSLPLRARLWFWFSFIYICTYGYVVRNSGKSLDNRVPITSSLQLLMLTIVEQQSFGLIKLKKKFGL